MADKQEKAKTVRLIAPSGFQVSVAESKRDALVANGYTVPKAKASTTKK